MKMKPLHLFLYTIAAAVAVACSGWDDSYGDLEFKAVSGTSLDVDQPELDYNDAAAYQILHIGCQGGWKASVSASWVILSAQKGDGSANIEVWVEANKTAQLRRATITITNGVMTKTVIVAQNPISERLTVSTNEKYYTYEGRAEDWVEVSSNVAWTVSSNASWATVSKHSNGQGFVLGVQRNISTAARQAVIIVNGNTQNQYITITQQGVAAPVFYALKADNITKHDARCIYGCYSPQLDFIEMGVCLSTNGNPDLTNSTVQKLNNAGNGELWPSFTFNNLKSQTTYYVRPYVKTELGTAYGDVVTFTTNASIPQEGDNQTPKD